MSKKTKSPDPSEMCAWKDEEKIKKQLQRFFSSPVDIPQIIRWDEVEQVPQEGIEFIVQVPADSLGETLFYHNEISVCSIDWDTRSCDCYISAKNFNKLAKRYREMDEQRKETTAEETNLLKPHIVTLNNGQKATRTIEKRNGTVVEVIDTFKPIPE